MSLYDIIEMLVRYIQNHEQEMRKWKVLQNETKNKLGELTLNTETFSS